MIDPAGSAHPLANENPERTDPLLKFASDRKSSDVPGGPFQKWICVVCGLIYDEAMGLPEDGIAPQTRFADIPDDWRRLADVLTSRWYIVTMRFCAQCGQAMMLTRLEADTRERAVCSACHYVDYQNPKVLVWCFAYFQQQLLLCRRAIPPAIGMWSSPGGFVEAGESLEEAACREMMEEVGIYTAPSSLILYRVASIPHMNEVYVGFRVELDSIPELHPGPEVYEARFWREDEFPFHEFAYREMLKGIPEDIFACIRTGIFPVFAHTVSRS